MAQSKPYLGSFVVGLRKTTKYITGDIRPERETGMLDYPPERGDRRCVNRIRSEAEGHCVYCLTHSSCVEVTAFFHPAGFGSVMNAGHLPSNRALSPVGVVSVNCRPACLRGVIPCRNNVTLQLSYLRACFWRSGLHRATVSITITKNVITSQLNLRHIRLAYVRLTGLREAFLFFFTSKTLMR